ncbi:MAG: nicotinate-nucleotide--dimethylbenzimidazole phosphoribosyltransferase [Myxococcales bacterium]|nr:nicotinate-nucleotide--dimethylbenzimidazole phosphoribosyltransferase [Myxococcales bacterium]
MTPLCTTSQKLAEERQAKLTKPPGSLGYLEMIVSQLAAIQSTTIPVSRPAVAMVFAADHPVAQHGVSAYPQVVTHAMVKNFLAGGAASSVLTQQLQIPLNIIDVGVECSRTDPFPPPVVPQISYYRDRVADQQEGDLRIEDALSPEIVAASLQAGRAAIQRLPEPPKILLLGEMGIGNTTIASALSASILSLPARDVVGAGTGLDPQGIAHKKRIVEEALERNPTNDPWKALASFGGREIVAMIGAAHESMKFRACVVVDGFTVTAAMLILSKICPNSRYQMIFGHQSPEPGHQLILDALDAKPIINLQMRLGEASGALAAMPLVELACALHRDMATFREASVPQV